MAWSGETTTGDDLQTPPPRTFLTRSAPDRTIPEHPLTESSTMRLVVEELAVEGNLRSAERGWMLPAYMMCGPKRVAAAGG